MRLTRQYRLFLFLVLWGCSAECGILSNVLQNSGFELGTNDIPSGWMPWGNAWRQGPPSHSGTNAGKVFGNWSSPTNLSWFYQVFPAGRGQIWNGTAWAYHSVDDRMIGANRAYLTIGFLDAASHGILYCNSPRQITAGSPTDQWIPLSVKARAPWNTAYVTFILNFMQVTNAGGSARFDDCEFGLSSTDTVYFANREWIVYDWTLDWVNRTNMVVFSTNCVTVDTNGWLHLSIRNLDGHWWCGQIESVDWLGYGEYAWSLEGPLDLLESNTIVGLFSFDEPRGETYYEIDIEASRALLGGTVSNLLYTVQPWTLPANGYQTPMTLTNTETTHRFQWTPGGVHWLSYYGHDREPVDSNHVFGERVYVSDNVPPPPARCDINFWLCEGLAPEGTQYLEYVVKDFHFKPFAGVLLTDDFDDASRSNLWSEFGYSDHEIEETNGCLRVRPGLSWETAGYQTAREQGWGESALQYTFSALLKTIHVDTVRSGDDIAGVLSFCSESNNAWVATNAFMLESLYDEQYDRLALVFFCKDQAPGGWGQTNFYGVVTNVSRYFSAGGIDLRLTLDRDSYVLAVCETNGLPISMAVDSGSLTGRHNLSWRLDHGYWQIGAWNDDPARGSVFWDRTEIRVDPPSESPFTVDLEMTNQQALLSWSSAFYRVYSVMKSTNLFQVFVPCSSHRYAVPPLNVFTDDLDSVDSGYYRVESSPDVL